jgi:hypothetical protein
MNGYTKSPYAGTGGFYPDVDEVRVIAKGAAVARGAVRVLDHARVIATSIDNTETSVHRCVIAPATTDARRYGVAVIALEDGLQDREFVAARAGQVLAIVTKASNDVAAGAPLVMTAGGLLSADLTAGHKVIARALAAITAPGAGGKLGMVLFDPQGFGVVPA